MAECDGAQRGAQGEWGLLIRTPRRQGGRFRLGGLCVVGNSRVGRETSLLEGSFWAGKWPRPGPLLGLGEGVWCAIQLEQTGQVNESSRVSSLVSVAGDSGDHCQKPAFPSGGWFPSGSTVSWHCLVIQYYRRNSSMSGHFVFQGYPQLLGLRILLSLF